MKSYGGLWERIVSDDNLQAAWRRVRRNHAHAEEVLSFEANLKDNLAELKRELIDGVYRPSGYRTFKIWDPKPRIISCAPVRDRVAHHALCAVIAPLLERGFSGASHASERDFLQGRRTIGKLVASARSICGAAEWFGFHGILGSRNDDVILATEEKAASGSNRSNRGGSWNNNAQNCRSAYRNNYNNPSNRNNNLGFRLSSTPRELTAHMSHSVWPVSGECAGTKNALPEPTGKRMRASAHSRGWRLTQLGGLGVNHEGMARGDESLTRSPQSPQSFGANVEAKS